jgi:hypothetical protein
MASAGVTAVHVVPGAQCPALPSSHHGTHEWFWHVVSGAHDAAPVQGVPETPPTAVAATQAV